MRLQKFLAEAGIASRRQAEKIIEQGRVDVNGSMAVLGQSIDPERDRVMVDGEGIRRPKVRVYAAMNKPRGFICTADDPEGRPTVYELLPRLPSPVHSVGRLDFNSEGLLLFTSDGDLTRALTRPASRVPRVYQVKIQGKAPRWALTKLLRGVPMGGRKARFDKCDHVRDTSTNVWLEVVLSEGRNREVRRMFEAVGMNVLKLKRVAFGPIKLGKMKTGSVRLLAEDEVEALKTCTEGRSGYSPPPPSGRKSRSEGPPRSSGGRGSRRNRA
ncbi:MAG: rRNA pseudouridine synthase [Deltaproteobacteria bacterium]|nr:rRNA pseudouridine synthase [Deltaproteobacteria bacterium]